MSAKGQKRTLPVLFYYLVGTGNQRKRNSEPDRLGGLEIDDQLEFGGLKNRKLIRLYTFKNTSGVKTDLTIHVESAATVADQAARCCKFSLMKYCRDRERSDARHNLFSSAVEEWIRGNKKRLEFRLIKRRE